jgi:uncharacterized membrane protein
MLKLSNFPMYLGYAVSLVTAVAGITFVTGITFSYVPAKMRITFGVVLILWGVYRFVLTRNKANQEKRNEQEEESDLS